jgi:hypothetical protein
MSSILFPFFGHSMSREQKYQNGMASAAPIASRTNIHRFPSKAPMQDFFSCNISVRQTLLITRVPDQCENWLACTEDGECVGMVLKVS